MSKHSLLTLTLSTLLTSCCCIGIVRDDDRTPVIISGYYEGAFSIRIFEVKTDSTFRYYRDIMFNRYDVQGKWTREADTFQLYYDYPEYVTYGKIYVSNERARFVGAASDTTLRDLPNPNFGLRYYDPPRNIDFGVRRPKPSKSR